MKNKIKINYSKSNWFKKNVEHNNGYYKDIKNSQKLIKMRCVVTFYCIVCLLIVVIIKLINFKNFSIDNCLVDLTTNEIKNIENVYYKKSIDETLTISLITFKDQINNIKNEKKDFYIIEYNNDNSKYICGYINKEQLDENTFYCLEENMLSFDFNQIVWKIYDNQEEIKKNQNDNYMLVIVYKINNVNILEDINGNKINVLINDYVYTKFHYNGDKVELIVKEIISTGKYFVYSNKLKNYENLYFGNLVGKMNYEDINKNFIFYKFIDKNTLRDILGYYINDVYYSYDNLRYGDYYEEIQKLYIGDNEINGNILIGKLNYNKFKRYIKSLVRKKLFEK